jgi:hypothetical protein
LHACKPARWQWGFRSARSRCRDRLPVLRLGTRLEYLLVGLHDADETVAAPRHRLDVFRMCSLVGQCPAQRRDRMRQAVVGDDDTGPDGIDQLVFLDEALTALDQIDERIECA